MGSSHCGETQWESGAHRYSIPAVKAHLLYLLYGIDMGSFSYTAFVNSLFLSTMHSILIMASMFAIFPLEIYRNPWPLK